MRGEDEIVADKDIILIVAHGSPEQGADNTASVARCLHSMIHPGCTDQCIQVAYLQFMEPGVMVAIEGAVSRGASRIIVHPFFLSSGYHVNRTIPDLIQKGREQYPDVEFICSEPLGVDEKFADIVLKRIRDAAGDVL